MKKFLVALTFTFFSSILFAQGDDCASALYLPDVNDYCSNQAQYTNIGATTGSFSVASCWGAAQTEDVWFSFIATGTDVLISVSGNGSDGTITNPKVALYSGPCSGTLTEHGCTNTSTNDVAQLYEGGMVVGQTYLIRVSTTSANEGTFKLCVNSYTQPINPGADCSGAAYLCDKSTVSNASFSGGGTDIYEPEFSSCMSNENNSVWYYWRCNVSGTFTFDITPSNATQDIDYIFYQLNSSNVCGTRTVLRCNTSACLNATGSTGLSAADFDISEDPGCDPGENAYCSQVNLVAGTYYAILIDNATNNSGFSLSFGGTAQFTGPNPNITNTNLVICAGQTVTFDGSTSTNSAGGLNWVFSTGSSPTSATGAGPHTVTYATPGNYVAILNAADATGCQDTETANITVNSCGCTITATNSGDVCEGTTTFDLTATTVAGATYSWSGPNGFNSASQNPSSVTLPLTAGSYNYTVTADNGTSTCTSTTTIVINPLPTINAVSTSVCVGSTINLAGSGTPAAVNPWVSSANGIATVSNIGVVTGVSAGSSIITYTDVKGCATTISITVVSTPTAAISGNTTVCAGGNADVTFTGTPNATVNYQINGGAIQQVVLDAAGNAIVNTGVIQSNATYSLVSVQINPPTGCSSNLVGQVTIQVGNGPVVQPLAAISACVGTVVSVPAFVSNPVGATFDWTNDNTATGLGAAGSGNIATFTGASTGVSSVSVVPTLNGCIGAPMVFTISILNPPVSNAGPDVSFCEGVTGNQIGAQATAGFNYSWSPSIGLSNPNSANPSLSGLSSGQYIYTLTTSVGACSSTDDVFVTVNPTPTAQFNFNPAVISLDNPVINTQNNSVNAVNYFWSVSDGFTSTNTNITHTLPETAGYYTITLTATNGNCVDSMSIVVELEEEVIIYVPNSFTPDGDEFNNDFKPVLNAAFDYQNYLFEVYNRWGEVIFESHNPDFGWDGTYHDELCKDGQYVWRIEVKQKNKDKQYVYTGHINLLH